MWKGVRGEGGGGIGPDCVERGAWRRGGGDRTGLCGKGCVEKRGGIGPDCVERGAWRRGGG